MIEHDFVLVCDELWLCDAIVLFVSLFCLIFYILLSFTFDVMRCELAIVNYQKSELKTLFILDPIHMIFIHNVGR